MPRCTVTAVLKDGRDAQPGAAARQLPAFRGVGRAGAGVMLPGGIQHADGQSGTEHLDTQQPSLRVVVEYRRAVLGRYLPDRFAGRDPSARWMYATSAKTSYSTRTSALSTSLARGARSPGPSWVTGYCHRPRSRTLTAG